MILNVIKHYVKTSPTRLLIPLSLYSLYSVRGVFHFGFRRTLWSFFSEYSRPLKIDSDLLSASGKGRLQRAFYRFQLHGAINSFNNLDHFSALDPDEHAILLLTKFSSDYIKELASIHDYFVGDWARYMIGLGTRFLSLCSHKPAENDQF